MTVNDKTMSAPFGAPDKCITQNYLNLYFQICVWNTKITEPTQNVATFINNIYVLSDVFV